MVGKKRYRCLANFLTAIGLVVTVSGCASDNTAQQPEASRAEQLYLSAINKQKQNAPKAREEAKTMLEQSKQVRQKANWVQPRNKPEECRVFMAGPYPNNIRLFWDGGCKDGYAYGIGREFVTYQYRGKGVDEEWVASYNGGKIPPVYLRRYDRLQKIDSTFAFGSDTSMLTTELLDVEGKGLLAQNLLSREAATRNGLTYEIASFPHVPTLAFLMRGTSPEDVIRIHLNNGYAVVPRSVLFGVHEISHFKNGTVALDSKTEGGLQTMPWSYVDKSQKIEREIRQAIDKILPAIKKSQKMVDSYLTKVCSDTHKVKFMTVMKYKEICGPYGYFTSMVPASKKVGDVLLARQKRSYNEWHSRRRALDEEKRQVEYARRPTESLDGYRTAREERSNEFWNTFNNTMRSNVPMYQPPRATAPRYYHRNGGSIVGANGTICRSIGTSVACN